MFPVPYHVLARIVLFAHALKAQYLKNHENPLPEGQRHGADFCGDVAGVEIDNAVFCQLDLQA